MSGRKPKGQRPGHPLTGAPIETPAVTEPVLPGADDRGNSPDDPPVVGVTISAERGHHGRENT